MRVAWLGRAVAAAIDWKADFFTYANTPPHEQVLLVVAGRAPGHLDRACEVVKSFLATFKDNLTGNEIKSLSRRYSNWFAHSNPTVAYWMQAVQASSSSVL